MILLPSTTESVGDGDSLRMVCTVHVDKTLVNVAVNVDVYLVGPRGVNVTRTFDNSNISEHETDIRFNRISAKDSGQFKCNATVTASSTMYFLDPAHDDDTFTLTLSELILANACRSAK